MNLRTRLARLDLIVVLVVVAFVELALNRLAVPVLRPAGAAVPPDWHRDLDRVGLFVFYLATLLALGVGLAQTWELCRRRKDGMPTAPRVVLGIVCAAFFGLAVWNIIGATWLAEQLPFLAAWPAEVLSFHLESAFTLTLLVIAMAAASRAGDGRVKVGLLLIAAPFLLHYYGTFALRVLVSEQVAHDSALPDRLRDLGQWAIAFSSVGVALCFAPRPLGRALGRPGPMVIAGFVGAVIAVVLVRHQDVGMQIASMGLGIELPPAAPAPVLAAFVVAAMAVAWTLTTTLSSGIAARRRVGLGFALVVLGGYAFAWPLELLTVIAGVLAIAEGAARLPAEGADAAQEESAPWAPQITPAVWQAYVDALATSIGAAPVAPALAGETRLHGVRDGVPFSLGVLHPNGQLRIVEICFGDERSAGPASWTLFARPDGPLGAGGTTHPAPPPSSGRPLHTGDEAFDRRFRVLDAGGVTERLFDESLRARAAALLDGWVAVWPDGTLRYQVFPGRGAPVDHPVPQTELAFRGGSAAVTPERLVRVFELLGELAARARA